MRSGKLTGAALTAELQEAREACIDTIWFRDTPLSVDGLENARYPFDPIVAGTFAVLQGFREIGFSVLTAGYRSELQIARQISSLVCLSEATIHLGIGRGAFQEVNEHLGSTTLDLESFVMTTSSTLNSALLDVASAGSDLAPYNERVKLYMASSSVQRVGKCSPWLDGWMTREDSLPNMRAKITSATELSGKPLSTVLYLRIIVDENDVNAPPRNIPVDRDLPAIWLGQASLNRVLDAYTKCGVNHFILESVTGLKALSAALRPIGDESSVNR